MGISKLELIEAIEEIAPVALAEGWDNCGMQIDLQPENVEKVMVCLEISKDIIDEAVANNVDFIVTHHPLYFRGMKKVDSNDVIGNYTCKLIKEDISVYSSHTCFDKAQMGNNFYLAELLGLERTKSFEEIVPDMIGVYGELSEEISLSELLEHIAKAADIPKEELRFIGKLDSKLKNVGLCTGAGVEACEAAQKLGCEVFITGDVKHHDAVNAMEIGMNVIDAGHYGTEKIFIKNMAQQLREKLGDKVQIIEAVSNRNPFDFL